MHSTTPACTCINLPVWLTTFEAFAKCAKCVQRLLCSEFRRHCRRFVIGELYAVDVITVRSFDATGVGPKLATRLYKTRDRMHAMMIPTPRVGFLLAVPAARRALVCERLLIYLLLVSRRKFNSQLERVGERKLAARSCCSCSCSAKFTAASGAGMKNERKKLIRH